MIEPRAEAFVSYAELDRDRAEQINDRLTAQGVRTHFWHRNVEIGAQIEFEERQLRNAITVVAMLGEHGWGPNHIKQVAGALERKTPVLPVLIGEPPSEAFGMLDGLFQKQRYLDLREDNPDNLQELLQAIKDYAPGSDGRVEYFVRLLIDRDDEDRYGVIRQLSDGTQINRTLLAARLRAEIDGPYSPASEQKFAASPRDTGKVASIRSWMLSALLLSEPASDATRLCALDHVSEKEPNRNVRFWTLAGIHNAQVDYLRDAVAIARNDSEAEISDLARLIDRDPEHIEALRRKLYSEIFETAWEALRALRIVPASEIVSDICKQLLREAGGTALAYDVLYALSHRQVAAAAATTLREQFGIETVVAIILSTAAQSNAVAVEAFTSLLVRLGPAEVRPLLDSATGDPATADVARRIIKILSIVINRSDAPATWRPGFSADGVAGQQDQLDIEAEVRTFAAIMMARDVEPPLAIGLFGDWGSGKSFFMRSLQDTIAALSARARETQSSPYCAHVVQIQFNAWHYVDAHLWASLVTFILEKLAAHVSPTASIEQQHNNLLGELEIARAEQTEVEAEQKRARESLASSEHQLSEVRAKRQEKELTLADLRARDVANLLMSNPDLKEQLTSALSSVGVPKAVNSVQDLQEAVAEARSVRGSALELIGSMSLRSSRGYVVALVVVLFGAPALAMLLRNHFEALDSLLTAITAGLTQVVALVGTITLWIRQGTAAIRENLAKVEAAKAKVDELLEQKRAVVSEEEVKLRREVEQLRANEQQLETRLDAASARVAEVETRLQNFKEAGSLARFLAERTGSDDYRKHLGLISMVRRDFEALSTRLSTQGLLGGVRVERIVLYIDDLDRCPAENVVDVLQAVHLLLAFKLFVVVVGVDSRWLLSSLASHYAEFKNPGRRFSSNRTASLMTTPQHYLEKIFQIPYTLRPMNEDGYSRLIGQIMGGSRPAEVSDTARKQPPRMPTPAATPQVHRDTASTPNSQSLPSSQRPAETSSVRTPLPTPQADAEKIAVHEDALAIQPWEVKFAQSLHALIPSPRAAKRLSNTYRILKARLGTDRLHKFEGTQDLPGDFQVPLLLLAMSIHAPRTTAEWFTELMSNAGSSSIGGALHVPPGPGDRAALAARVRNIIEVPTFPQDPQLLHEWIPHVARFSFDLSRGVSSGDLAAPIPASKQNGGADGARTRDPHQSSVGSA